MRGADGGDTGGAEVVRRRLDAVLGQGRPRGASSLRADDLGGLDLDDVDDVDDVDGVDDLDGEDRRAGDGRRRRPGSTRRGGRHAEDGDLAEGLGLWPQLVGALADRVPVAVRHGRWGVSGPVVAAVLVVSAVVVLVLAVRSSAGAPGVPVPVRAGAGQGVAAQGVGSPGATATSPVGAPVPPVPTSTPADGAAPPSSGARSTAAAPGAEPPGASAPTAPAEVVVHVVGRVGRAGLVHLPTGSRVGDALDAAGGPAPDADLARVNLARPLVDGEQVVVPAPGEELASAPSPAAAAPPGATVPQGAGVPTGAADGGAAGGTTGPVDLNTATEADLDALPGIGPVLAERILAMRTQLGSFTSVDELGEVSGIGDARMSELRELVVVP